MLEKVAESIRSEIENLELALKLLETPALKKIVVDQNGDCESQAQLFEQMGDESRAQAMREIDKRIKQAFSEHDSMHVTDALPQVVEQIRSEIEILDLALKMLETPALKKIIVDQNGDCESQAQFFEQIGDESRARAIRKIGKRIDQLRKSNQNSSRQTSSSSNQSSVSRSSRTVVIQNRAGIHARPASVFVQTASKFKSKIKIKANGKTADAKSILSIMSLGLSKGTEITISADGEDADEAVDALVELIDSKFGEDY